MDFYFELNNMRRKIFNIYNDMPYSMKKISSFFGNVIPKKWIFGRQYREYLSMIKKTEFLHSDHIQELKKREISKILLHAYKTTIFYSTALSKLNVSEVDIVNHPLEILEQMPFIDKTIVRENYNEFISGHLKKSRCDYTSTGGTSGEPFYFHINSDRSAKEWAFMTDQWSRVGFNLQSKRATFRGSKIDNKNGWEYDWITSEIKFSSFELTDEYLNSIWPILSEFKPNFIYSYPSTAIALCQFLERNNKQFPNSVYAFLIGSENIYGGQEEYIQSVSRKQVYKWYGHSEKLILGGECENSKNYHAYPQYGYSEFINDKGQHAKPGEFSELVGTGYMNTIVPFIRYRTGDYCDYLGEYCPECKRYYKIFGNVKGRWTQEFLYGKHGNSICMSAINVHSNNFKNVFRYQFYQDKIGKAILKIVPRKKFTEVDKKKILQEFNNKFNGNVEVSARIVSNIPVTKRGKYKYIDQKVK